MHSFAARHAKKDRTCAKGCGPGRDLSVGCGGGQDLGRRAENAVQHRQIGGGGFQVHAGEVGHHTGALQQALGLFRVIGDLAGRIGDVGPVFRQRVLFLSPGPEHRTRLWRRFGWPAHCPCRTGRCSEPGHWRRWRPQAGPGAARLGGQTALQHLLQTGGSVAGGRRLGGGGLGGGGGVGGVRGGRRAGEGLGLEELPVSRQPARTSRHNAPARTSAIHRVIRITIILSLSRKSRGWWAISAPDGAESCIIVFSPGGGVSCRGEGLQFMTVCRRPERSYRESAPQGAVPATAGAVSEAVPLFSIAGKAMFEWGRRCFLLFFPAGRRWPYFFRHRKK